MRIKHLLLQLRKKFSKVLLLLVLHSIPHKAETKTTLTRDIETLAGSKTLKRI